MLGSIVKQLTKTRGKVSSALVEGYATSKDKDTAPSLEVLLEALSDICDEEKEVLVVIDALDECAEELRWPLIDALRDCSSNLWLMITSRYLDNNEDQLEKFAKIEIRAHKDDLELFVDRQIARNRNLKIIVEKDTAMRVDIKTAVIRTSEDMYETAADVMLSILINPRFLLARLYVESPVSSAALSISHVRKTLQTLPTTLDATYHEAMERISAQPLEHSDLALKALAWFSYAFR